MFSCSGGGIGRHAGLKILFERVRVRFPPGVQRIVSGRVKEFKLLIYFKRSLSLIGRAVDL